MQRRNGGSRLLWYLLHRNGGHRFVSSVLLLRKSRVLQNRRRFQSIPIRYTRRHRRNRRCRIVLAHRRRARVRRLMHWFGYDFGEVIVVDVSLSTTSQQRRANTQGIHTQRRSSPQCSLQGWLCTTEAQLCQRESKSWLLAISATFWVM